MNCPACSSVLTERTTGSLTVDICEDGCGGIFFDRFEIQQVDEAPEGAGEALLQWSNLGTTKTPNTSKRYQCPRCDMIMMRSLFKPDIKVTVDTCPKCAGLWLDKGELNAIRDATGSDADRKKAAQRFVYQAFADIRGGNR